MKKWMKKVVAGAVVLSSSIGLAGCNIFTSNPAQESYVFKGYEDTYYVNDVFSIVGTKLRITGKDGKTEEISVTEDMVKHIPDMSTPGQKKVVIEYNGTEYEFTITIENRTNEQLMAKLKSFLRRYESNKDSLIEAGIITDLQARYMNEIVNINEQEAIALLSQMFDNDKLLDTAYNALFDAIVQGSFDLDESYIISSNQLKAKLDTLKVLEQAKQTMSNFDMRTYLIDLILPRTDVYYISNISDYINNICQIKSVSGKMAVNDLISKYYYKLKSFEAFDIADAYTELLTKINIHSISPVVKEAASVLNTKDPETILHVFSSMIESQWINYGYVMDKDILAEHVMMGLEHPVLLNTTLAKDLVKRKANAEKLIAYNLEETIKDLVNCESTADFKAVVLNALNAYEDYASEMIEIIEIQKANNIVLVMKNGNEYESNMPGAFIHNPDPTTSPQVIFEAYYDDEIEYYTSGRDNAQQYYNDINELGFIATLEKNALIEELFENFEYPEENKQQAINDVYDILNSELEGVDLYWAIANILFPDGANEHIEEVKSIVDSYLNNGLVGAIEEHQFVEKIIDFLGNYPEEHKQEAIDTIYSILNGEKSGKDLYLDIIKILTPNDNGYYIDYACGFINEYLSIESVTGQDEIRTLITRYFEHFKTGTEFDARSAYTEILNAINIHSTNEVVKTVTKDLESLELEQMVHIISDIIYTQELENTQIATTGTLNYSDRDYQIIESQDTQNLVNRYASNLRNNVRAYEDAVWNIINADSFEDLFDIVLSCLNTYQDYIDEEIAIVEVLDANKWILGEEYELEYFDGYEHKKETRFGEYYSLEKEPVWNDEEWDWEYIWMGYGQQIDWLNENKQEAIDLYNNFDIIKSLVFEPREAIDKLVEDYKQEIIDAVMEVCYNYIGVEPESYMASDLEIIFTDAINDYLYDELDKEKLLSDIEEIINIYATDETKTVLNVGYMLYIALNYDESVDYNEIFKDIELPSQIESIDYNKLMSQIMKQDTYEIFDFNDIEIEYIQDDSGKIVAEKLTLKVDVNFDTLISSLKGEVTFTLTLDFDGEQNEQNEDKEYGED